MMQDRLIPNLCVWVCSHASIYRGVVLQVRNSVYQLGVDVCIEGRGTVLVHPWQLRPRNPNDADETDRPIGYDEIPLVHI